MSIPKIWRYGLIAIWVIYVICAIRIGALFLGQGVNDASAYDAASLFTKSAAVPIGVLTALILLLQLRFPFSERKAYKSDERKRQLWLRSATAAFWVLLFGNCLAMSAPESNGWAFSIMVISTVLAFGVCFLAAAADEFLLMNIERRAD